MRRFLLLALLVACKQSDPGPACDKVVDHMLEVTKQQLAGHDTVELGNRTVMIEQCEKRKMSPELRSCMMAAKTLTQLSECQAKAKPPAPAPAPAPSGSGG